jgi:hypothetical protein
MNTDSSRSAPVPDTSSASSVEHLWHTYDAVGEWIRAADTKSEVVLVAVGALAAVVAALTPSIKPFLTTHPLAAGSLMFALFLCAVSAIFAIWCLSPTTGCTDPGSLIFFGTVAANFGTADQYAAAAQAAFADQSIATKSLSQ